MNFIFVIKRIGDGIWFRKKIKDGIVRAGKDLVGKITIVVKKKQPDVRSSAPQDQRSVLNHGMKVENREIITDREIRKLSDIQFEIHDEK